MRAFGGEFANLPDYIQRITREIWEERGVGRSLDKYYAPDIIVRAANAITTSSDGVTGSTLATLHEFPDRQLVYEDVIWTGDDSRGYLSSHRLISVMRKQGAGAYGPATGNIVRSRIIADCVVNDGVITEEWLVRDHASFAVGLRRDAPTMARELAASDVTQFGKVVFFDPAQDVPGSYRAQIDNSKEALIYSRGWQDIWGAKHPAAIRELYFEGAAVSVPGGETLAGHSDIDRFVISYLASFPNAQFEVDHLLVNRDPGKPVRLALRWSVRAVHTGWGRFGKPSGAPIYIMGMTHAYLVDGKVTMEWIVIDEIAVWKQIYAHMLSCDPDALS